MAADKKENMLNDETYRLRTTIHEASQSTVSVTKCAKELFALLREAQTGTVESTEKAYDRAMQELSNYEFAMTRLEAIARRSDAETQEYRKLQASIDHSISETTARLEQLKAELAAAKIERTQRQKYEEIAREVNKRPTRDALQASISSVEEDLAAAMAERQAIDAKMAARRSQFQLLFSAIADLQRTFIEEAEAEQRKSAAAAAASGFDALAHQEEREAARGDEDGDASRQEEREGDDAAAGSPSEEEEGGGGEGAEGEEGPSSSASADPAAGPSATSEAAAGPAADGAAEGGPIGGVSPAPAAPAAEDVAMGGSEGADTTDLTSASPSSSAGPGASPSGSAPAAEEEGAAEEGEM